MNCPSKLIRHNGPHPPGGFPFVDPKTGMKFSGQEGGIRDTVERVLQHRLSNPKIFSGADLGFDDVLEEVDCWQCTRLGSDSRWCTNGKPGSPQIVVRVANQFCPDCGSTMTEKLCATCGGRKVVGYTCGKCGKEYSK